MIDNFVSLINYKIGGCQTYGCRVSYYCAEEHELVGKAEKVCSAEGNWAPKELPQCVQVRFQSNVFL